VSIPGGLPCGMTDALTTYLLHTPLIPFVPLYRKVQEELVRMGRELKEQKENGEKETRTRKQLETALKVEQN
jgi:hypothetical protein